VKEGHYEIPRDSAFYSEYVHLSVHQIYKNKVESDTSEKWEEVLEENKRLQKTFDKLCSERDDACKKGDEVKFEMKKIKLHADAMVDQIKREAANTKEKLMRDIADVEEKSRRDIADLEEKSRRDMADLEEKFSAEKVQIEVKSTENILM
jgi:hypothetical protein